MSRPLRPCGTPSAYTRHIKAREKACAPCRRAWADYQSKRRIRSPRQLIPCGTHAAYQRHLLVPEEPCQACRAAHGVYMREWNRTRRLLAGVR